MGDKLTPIADLAEQSLLAIRVITCLDAMARPLVTHAMLRILCMLEPSWPMEANWRRKSISPPDRSGR